MIAATEAQRLDPIFVSVKQMSTMLGLSVWVCYSLLDAQKVESRYEGRRRLVVLKSLRQYADNLPEYPTDKSA